MVYTKAKQRTKGLEGIKKRRLVEVLLSEEDQPRKRRPETFAEVWVSGVAIVPAGPKQVTSSRGAERRRRSYRGVRYDNSSWISGVEPGQLGKGFQSGLASKPQTTKRARKQEPPSGAIPGVSVQTLSYGQSNWFD